MKFVKVVFFFCIIFVIIGCSDYHASNHYNSFLGTQYTELINKLGEPREIIDDGTGGKIYSWSDIPIDKSQIDNPTRREYRVDDIYRVNARGTIYRKGL